MSGIIREPLAEKGRKRKVGGYSRVNWQILQEFVQKFAQDEADSREDVSSISVVNREDDGRSRAEFTLMGHRGQSLVKFYASS